MDLIFTSDSEPGITRRRYGKGFAYFDPQGSRLPAGEILSRIQSLAIPPAYRDVWICLPPNGHLQATGRDDRNRKQYRYHDLWHQLQGEKKFSSLLVFADVLPRLRDEIDARLRRTKMDRDLVAALAIAIIDRTGARIGNPAYRDANGSYGITTLVKHHAETNNRRLDLHYRGKHGRKVKLHVESRLLAKRLARCQELPGQELFHYLDDDGSVRPLGSVDVNHLLAGIAGDGITAKTFRTWRGSLLAFQHLLPLEPAASKRERKKQETAAVREAASHLHNTLATCRKYYVHPRILSSWLDGTFPDLLAGARRSRAFAGLADDERLLARFLKQIES